MDSSPNQNHDYTIFDSKGIRMVKNGVEYPITEEEWRKLHPQHKDIGCTSCKFVQDKETLLLYIIPREFRAKATEKPLFVGLFTMPGWTGHSAWYLFKCKDCGSVVVDYPHGYRGSFLYLHCGSCSSELILDGRYREIYEREGAPAPPSLLEWLKYLWKHRPTRKDRERQKALLDTYEKIEQEHGVRVVTNPNTGSDLREHGSNTKQT